MVSEISGHTEETPAAILTGDFNARPDSATHKNLTGSGFVDTFLAAGNEDDQSANTFHAFQGTSYRDKHPAKGPRRIDWILLNDPEGRLTTESHSIIRDAEEVEGLYPSDHYPIAADFGFQEQSSLLED
jgi:endonuclease/exonuclease/phosphatase family metal-dependent hydrolase